jgi:glycosyltransferase involved in cell wall biosynthesis
MEKTNVSIFDRLGKQAGMNYYDIALAKGFEANDTRVTIYSNFKNSDVNAKAFYQEAHTNRLYRLFSHIAATIKGAKEAKRHDSALSIVHTLHTNVQTLLTVWINRWYGHRVAVIAHDLSSFVEGDSKYIYHKIYNRLAHHIIVHNQFSYDQLMPLIDEKNIGKVSILKHGGYLDFIDKKISKDLARYKMHLDKEKKYILFFASEIQEVKGLDILIEALSYLDDERIHLLIAGKPYKDDFSSYDRLIREFGLDKQVTKFTKYISAEERDLLFFSSDLNVVPYRQAYQNSAMLMAMSYSLSVIASDLEGNKEIIKDGENGLLFKCNDAKDLSKKIAYFFANEKELTSLAKEAFKSVRDNYSWNAIAKGYLKLIS